MGVVLLFGFGASASLKDQGRSVALEPPPIRVGWPFFAAEREDAARHVVR